MQKNKKQKPRKKSFDNNGHFQVLEIKGFIYFLRLIRRIGISRFLLWVFNLWLLAAGTLLGQGLMVHCKA
jgi:fatty acid desaturase